MTTATGATGTAQLATGTWAIDPVHSTIGFSVRHLMVSKVRGTFDTFSGAIVVAIGVWLLHWLYLRSSKERAFVRTGLGGQKVVMDGGAYATSGAANQGHPHPRSLGSVPRVLARYVREQKLLLAVRGGIDTRC